MSSPTTDQAHAGARDNVLGYVELMKSLLDSGTVDRAVVLMCQTLQDMGTGEAEAIAMFVVALTEMARPSIDLSAFEA